MIPMIWFASLLFSSLLLLSSSDLICFHPVPSRLLPPNSLRHREDKKIKRKRKENEKENAAQIDQGSPMLSYFGFHALRIPSIPACTLIGGTKQMRIKICP